MQQHSTRETCNVQGCQAAVGVIVAHKRRVDAVAKRICGSGTWIRLGYAKGVA